MDDVKSLLERAAPDEVGPGPYETIVRRGRRRQVRARAVSIGLPALVGLVGLAVAASLLGSSPARHPVIDRPPPSEPAPPSEAGDDEAGEVEIEPSPAPDAVAPETDGEPADDPDEPVSDPFASDTVTVAELGVEVFVVEPEAEDEPYHVRVITPEGERLLVPDGPRLSSGSGSVPSFVVDGRGGFAWQGRVVGSDRAPIFEVDAEGQQTLAVDPSHHAPTFAPSLVGPDVARDGYLVAQQVIDPGYPEQGSGTEMPEEHLGDLISVPWDGDHAIIASEVTAWESAVGRATHGEGVVYTLAGGAWTGLYVRPPGGDVQRVLDEGDGTGRWFHGIAAGSTPDVALVLLVPERSGPSAGEAAELVVVDLRAAQIVDRIEVPGFEQDGSSVAPDLSSAGDLLLVNRWRREDQQWLTPLVQDVPTGRWAVLEDVEGRAFLSRELG